MIERPELEQFDFAAAADKWGKQKIEEFIGNRDHIKNSSTTFFISNIRMCLNKAKFDNKSHSFTA